MDIPSFCVENRRKSHSFPFLRTALQPTEKMPKSFEFGVPLGGRIVEENCFKNIHSNSCNAQYAFQEVTKGQDCHSKKSCFDHFHKFSHFSFSRVVGGFVGSKSQGGSAFREPHQVWDIIFRQLMDSTCQATMNNNAQQYISISEAVSQSIFGQLNNSTNSSLDFSSLILHKHSDFLSSNKPSENMQVSNGSVCHKNSENSYVNKQVALNEDPSNTQLVSVHAQTDESKMKVHEQAAKQSYADVARTFAATKSEAANKSDRYQCVPVSLSQNCLHVNNRNSRKGNEKYRKRRQNVICYSQSSCNNSSQNQHMKSKILPDKCEDQIPLKFARNKFENSRHNKTENSNSRKVKSKDCSVPVIPAKDSKDQEERKRKYSKYRNYNMREKERKIVDQQVHDDVVFACNMPQQECQNWRCDHNRLSNVCNSRIELGTRRHNRAKNYKQQSRWHSPPPRTFVSDSTKISKPRTDDRCTQKDVTDILKTGEMCPDTLCNVEKSELNSSVNSEGSGGNSESSFSSSPNSSTFVVLPLRLRVSSECSLDSEDSSVIFEREDGDLDLEIESDSDSDFDSVNDFSSECDSEEDCDEVDFCFETPSEDTNIVTGSPFADVFSSQPDRLKDINEKWHKENNVLPKEDKIPKKVHFPGPEKLAKVHHMIHWPFAYREARRGPWEEIGRDRCRFKMRIEKAERDLSQILDPQHRRRIWEERMCDLGSI